MITNTQLGILHRRVTTLRALCAERDIDIADGHLFDPAAEAAILAGRLGSPWPHLASDPDLPEGLLAVDGEKVIDLLADLAAYLEAR